MNAAICRRWHDRLARWLFFRPGIAGLVLAVVVTSSCHRAQLEREGHAAPDLAGDTRELRAVPLPSADALAAYRRGGFLVSSGDLSFVGSVAFLAGATPDSTLAVLAISLPNRGLTFTRENERYRAAYDVLLELRRGDTLLRRERAAEEVRVGSFKETTRSEESVIFQQFLSVSPGTLSVSVTVRDAGSTHAGTAHAALIVPRLDSGTMATPIAVLWSRARTTQTARPDLIISPRATAVFGRDSSATFYVEAYGERAAGGETRAIVQLLGELSQTLFTDTVVLMRRGTSLFNGTVKVPLSRLGVGVLGLSARVAGDRVTSQIRAPLLVSFGEGLAVSSFEEMLGYLRFFASPDRLRALREAPAEERYRAWSSFLAATDPSPATPENEALRDYLTRLTEANIRFQEESGPGWLTDRGMIFTALGEPDERREAATGDPMQRNRVEVWEYPRYRSRFVFVDQTGFGRWRLTPGSEAEYHALMRRLSR